MVLEIPFGLLEQISTAMHMMFCLIAQRKTRKGMRYDTMIMNTHMSMLVVSETSVDSCSVRLISSKVSIYCTYKGSS